MYAIERKKNVLGSRNVDYIIYGFMENESVDSINTFTIRYFSLLNSNRVA